MVRDSFSISVCVCVSYILLVNICMEIATCSLYLDRVLYEVYTGFLYIYIESYMRRVVKPLEALLTSHRRIVLKDSAVSHHGNVYDSLSRA
jgi:hypothetical protein